MLRVLLTPVLIGIVALPHGICFCHFLDAAARHNDVNCEKQLPGESCCETEQPATPTKSTTPPADNTDDDDANCPCCKLRPVLACGPAPASAERDGAVSLVLLLVAHASAESALNIVGQNQSNCFRTHHGPGPLILCALRI
jgi:cell division septation protein DedD